MTARWYRGNIHTHTTNSDGDSPPEVVVAWYRDAGYDFLALTDHDVLTDPEGLRDTAGSMLLIRGEEVSSGDLHVNGLGIRERVAATFAPDVRATIQGNVDSIRAVGGVPSVNHPNFRWLVRPEDLAALRDVRLFEIHNAGPEVSNLGGRDGFPSVESTWDTLLTRRSPDAGCGRRRRPPLPGLGSAVLQPWSGVDVRQGRATDANRRSSRRSMRAAATRRPGWSWVTSSPRAGSSRWTSSRSGSCTTGRASSVRMGASSTSRMGCRPDTSCDPETATCVPASTTRTVSRPGHSRSSRIDRATTRAGGAGVPARRGDRPAAFARSPNGPGSVARSRVPMVRSSAPFFRDARKDASLEAHEGSGTDRNRPPRSLIVKIWVGQGRGTRHRALQVSRASASRGDLRSQLREIGSQRSQGHRIRYAV